MAKLTATHEGVTATRRTNRPYTHVVFGLYSPAFDAARVEADAARAEREVALDAEALDFLARGETPPAGHALHEVQASNYYHRFTRWDYIARHTDDAGRSFRTLTVEEARANLDRYDYAGSAARQRARAAELRAMPARWEAISWHHSADLAVKGMNAVFGGRYTKTAIVPVNPGA